jgi:hypothetical protein
MLTAQTFVYSILATMFAAAVIRDSLTKPKPLAMVIGTQPSAPRKWVLYGDEFEIDGYVTGFKPAALGQGVWSHVAFTASRPRWYQRALFRNIPDCDGKGRAIRADVLQISCWAGWADGHFRQLHIQNIPKPTAFRLKAQSRYEKVVIRGRLTAPNRPLNEHDFQIINTVRWGNDRACPIVIIDSVQSVAERNSEFSCDFAI